MAAHSGPGVRGNTQTLTTGAAEIEGSKSYPRTIVVQNVDASAAVYVGGHTGAALTTSNGFRVAAGESFAADLPPFSELYGIAGASVEIRFLVFDGNTGF